MPVPELELVSHKPNQ